MTGQIKFNAPEIVEDRWKSWANSNLKQGERKLLGIALTTFVMGLPRDLRNEFINWGRVAESESNASVNPEVMAGAFVEAMITMVLKRGAGQHPTDAEDEKLCRHFVDRILDPSFLKSAHDLMLRRAG